MNIDKYYIVVTEGITDCSLLEAILEKYMGYKSFERVKDLPQLNEGEGAVERLLLECAKISYQQLFEEAGRYKERIMEEEHRQIREACWCKEK